MYYFILNMDYLTFRTRLTNEQAWQKRIKKVGASPVN